MSEPLWSDERIQKLAGKYTDELDGNAYTYHLFNVALAEVRDDYEAALANQYQRIDRFVELVDQLERKLAEATEANSSCALYIASQMERIGDLEAQLAQRWEPLPDGYFQSSITNGMYAVSTRSDSLECYMAYMGEWKYICSIELPDNIRLCHLVERAEVQPPQAHEREIIEAMVEDWLQLYEPGSNEWADAQVIVSWLNNYRGTFADDLRQQVTERAEVQPYSHRNGETEPPTVAGRYWFDGYRTKHNGNRAHVRDMVEVNERGSVYNDVDGLTDEPHAYKGKWYGPIVAPWEDCHE